MKGQFPGENVPREEQRASDQFIIARPVTDIPSQDLSPFG
jgi:hypothetical protein